MDEKKIKKKLNPEEERNKEITNKKGTEYVDTYKIQIKDTDKKKGVKDLYKTGQKNLYALIQSHAQSQDIEYIIKRYASGDMSVIKKGEPIYADFTQLPDNLADYQKMIIDNEQIFEQLPLEIREQYNYSFSEFLADLPNIQRRNNEAMVQNIEQSRRTTTKSENTNAEEQNTAE